MPAKTWRGLVWPFSVSPMSRLRRISLSAPSTCWAATILAIRRSILVKFVDGDGGRASARLPASAGDMRLAFAVALLRRSRLARRLTSVGASESLVGLQQRVDLFALDAGHEVLVGLMVWSAGNGSQTFVQASGDGARKPRRSQPMQEGPASGRAQDRGIGSARCCRPRAVRRPCRPVWRVPRACVC